MDLDAKSTARDSVIYFLSIITLIISAISFGAICYQLINFYFPDPLAFNFGNYQAMRLSLATLLVAFPVYVCSAWFLRRDVIAHPAKHHLGVRRWLMYLAVFAASLVIIGDLITLIYNFLEGGLTARFIWKVIVILVIAGCSLFYYLAELYDWKYWRRRFAWIVIVAVAVVAVRAFLVIGSPQNQRLINFDNQKVMDLENIQSRLVYYWQQKSALPANLGDLNDPISGFTVPTDPQTNQSYGYNLTGPHAFQLCADFNLPATDSGNNIMDNSNWTHGAGQACFDRTIDSSLYPPAPKSAPMIPAQ